MPLKVRNAKEQEYPWTHWFLYGDSGTGKTTAAATFPSPLFIVPAHERSWTTLQGRDIDFVEVDTARAMLGTLEQIEADYKKSPNDFPYETLVVESLTHYSDLIQDDLKRGTSQMDQQKWGLFGEHLRTMQQRLRRLDVHVVFTALSRTETESGVVVGGPHLPGQSSVKLPASCDVTGFCECTGAGDKTKYVVHFRRRGHFFARSRLKTLPAKVENFNFADFESSLR